MEIKSSQIVIIPARITSGFEYKSIKFVVITDNEMIGVHKRTSTSKSKKLSLHLLSKSIYSLDFSSS